MTEQEVENSIRLTDLVAQKARAALKARRFVLEPDLIRALNLTAMTKVIETAGSIRQTDQSRPIFGSRHQPPPYREVADYLRHMCAYINDLPPTFPVDGDPKLRQALDRGIHVASYAIWRLNWIHPFEDGNGRTSRALGYLLLSIHSGMFDTASPALPDRIYREKLKFYRCLEAADVAYKKKKRIRIQQLENFVKKHYLAQLRESLDHTTDRSSRTSLLAVE
jgi:Fic family protein